MYVWHRINHQVPFLWRFHRVHHTDPALDSTSALRFHPVEVLISTALNCVLMVALGMSLEVFSLYKPVMVVVILFHHSNLRIPPHLDSWLRWVIVPPSLHRVHHSNLRWETDSDYGTIFSFWDRLFGSYRTRRTYHDIRFGIGRYDSPGWQQPTRLLVLPLRPLAPGDEMMNDESKFCRCVEQDLACRGKPRVRPHVPQARGIRNHERHDRTGMRGCVLWCFSCFSGFHTEFTPRQFEAKPR